MNIDDKKFKEFTELARKTFSGMLKDFGTASDDVFKEAEGAFEKASVAMQETLAELGFVVPVSRVSTIKNDDTFVVVVAMGKNLVQGSTNIAVNKAERVLDVSAKFESTKEGESFSESLNVKAPLPSNVLIDNSKASFKDGNLYIEFQIKKDKTQSETVEIKIS